MNAYHYILLTAFSFLSFSINAQTIQLDRKMPTVEQFGEIATLAFSGGLNSPQFNEVDFNNDGLDDLFIFDRVGDVPLAFLRRADGSLSLNQEMISNFPEMEAWVILRDYNNDGVMDIFTYNREEASGVKVYTGAYDSDNLLTFERFSFDYQLDIIPVATPTGGITQLYVSDIDYPSISDIDCDGDLDILTFNIGGGVIEYFQNRSIENGYGLDSLQFVLATNCYGGIYESGISESLSLSSSLGECAEGFSDGDNVEERHVGSTLLSIDEDGDGDQDLILGDLSFPNLNLSTNASSCTGEAWMNEQDINFPSYDLAVDLPIFPAAYYVDIDGDNIRDLIAAPNPGNNGIDHENVWYYRNVGQDDNPTFDFQQNDFLVENMIDVGTRSHPAFLDYNADGLMDLVVANSTYFELFGIKNTRLFLYENIGTESSPAFRLVDEDFLDMNQFSANQSGNGTFDLVPTFGDLDGDGDVDGLIGEVTGELFFVENTAGPGQPAVFSVPLFGYAGIDIGQAAAPQIVDLNRDGLADIVLGEKNGNINYFQNVGSVNNPMFGDDENTAPNVKSLGEVDTRIPGFSTGYATPQFVDFNGEYRLFVGTQFGPLEIYSNIEGNLTLESEAFVQDYENIPGLNEGEHIHPVLYDWDNDGFLDLVIGNERGGLSFFETNIDLNGTVDTEELNDSSLALHVYPNPASDQLFIELPADQKAQLMVFDPLGRMVYHANVNQMNYTLPVADYPSGVYLLQLTQNNQRFVKRFIVD